MMKLKVRTSFVHTNLLFFFILSARTMNKSEPFQWFINIVKEKQLNRMAVGLNKERKIIRRMMMAVCVAFYSFEKMASDCQTI